MGRKSLIDLNSMDPINSRWSNLRKRDLSVRRHASGPTPYVLLRFLGPVIISRVETRKPGYSLLLSSVCRECNSVREHVSSRIGLGPF